MSDDATSVISDEEQDDSRHGYPFVVGVGASAGGLDAIERLFDNMPFNTGMAFVVVQHLSPTSESMMGELLARHTEMPIHQVTDGMPVQKNCIYLIPPKKNMMLSSGKLLLTDQDLNGSLNLPIDIFFRSLAEDAGRRAIAIVLSGTGSDGSRGIREVHKAGGLVIAQDCDSANFDGMPRSAASTELVDVVCPPEQISTRLVEYHQNPQQFLRAAQKATEEVIPSGDHQEIFRLFRHKFGVDFSLYKPATIDRRIERRVQLTCSEDLKSYVELLNSETQELDALYRDLLVEVTQFFRDPDAFETLRREVIPKVVENGSNGEELRIWVPGCATGEEAFSLAMLFQDAINTNEKSLTFKVFATDLHPSSLETASAGVYSANSIENVPTDLRTKFFTSNGDLYHITRELRQKVIFAPNDITRDPPFTKIDFVSCRNVLIYLEPKVQKKVLSLFHFGLKTNGILFLGPSESLGDLNTEFHTIDRHWRIYRKERNSRLPMATRLPMNSALSRAIPRRSSFIAKAPFHGEGDLTHTKAFQQLLSKYVPPSLLVNEYFELLHTFGDASKFLKQPEGRSTLDVLKLARGDLRMAINSALHKAINQGTSVVFNGISLPIDGKDTPIKIVVDPYLEENVKLFLISLQETKQFTVPATGEAHFNVQEQSHDTIEVLDQELANTRESLQSTVEALETSYEELQSTNEELIASNEELQSTNEELHSVNEELWTVNEEHKQKIEELTQLTSDLDNLLKSTNIGTVFLDKENCIRMFTPAISVAFNMLEQDIGRPIDHIAFQLDHPNLMKDIEEVAQQGRLIERECKGLDDKTYLFRVMPYQKSSDQMEGIALTLTDISAIKEVERAEQRNLDLSNANKDLVDFARAVSHDLQAPLRSLSGSCQSLASQLPPQVAKEFAATLKQIDQSSVKASKMIQNLVAYSRISTRGKAMQPVDSQLLLEDVLEELTDKINQVQATVTAEELPTVNADDLQLRRVLLELLDNALKYTDQRKPVVQIQAERNNGDWVFSVRDNGVGIEECDLEKVFVIFQRLEFKQEVPGGGTGLALSKRIIERHGGRIWVESVPGEGSTFFLHPPSVEDLHSGSVGALL